MAVSLSAIGSCQVVPAIGFDLLYAFIIVRLDRKDLAWISNVWTTSLFWARHICAGF